MIKITSQRLTATIVSFFLIFSFFSALSQTIDVKKYGAKGDGETDDYYALKSIVDLVNKNGGGEVYFPDGIYYIDQYHNGTNRVPDLEFKNCNNLKIYGNNAIISVKGNFNRKANKQVDKMLFSNVTALIPLKINNCRNVLIQNLEIDGNVKKMTRDKGVVESGGHLIWISESEDVKLNNLYLHHAQTDGLVIRGTSKASKRITAYNVVASNNARQGMSISFLENGVFSKCKFSENGFTEGAYGSHAPSAGVDIEPSRVETIRVKDVLFENCEFNNNNGEQFMVSTPKTTVGITLKSCNIIALKSLSDFTLILAAKNVLIDNCQINCGFGSIYPTWKGMPNGSVTIKNSLIESSGMGMILEAKSKIEKVIISNNEFKFTGSKLKSYFLFIQNENLTFNNNQIYIPNSAFNGRKIQSFIPTLGKSVGNKQYN